MEFGAMLSLTVCKPMVRSMNPFRMQERDLDLIILEELYCDIDFQKWFAARIGLTGYLFRSAEHSATAIFDDKWGETDILSYYEKDGKIVAVLIEDKIASAFTDRQAERYHDRASDLIKRGHATQYVTVLIAPSSYLETVTKDARWGERLSIEELRDWFAMVDSNHARWRKQALTNCLDRISRNQAAGFAAYLQFSKAFAAFLATQPGLFSHVPTGDSWGFIVLHPEKRTHVQLAWKTGKNRVDLSFTGPHVGKAKHVEIPLGISAAFADGRSLATDMLGIDVPAVDLTIPLEEQANVTVSVIAALRELSLLVPLILAHPDN
jgi:hypothetical protein